MRRLEACSALYDSEIAATLEQTASLQAALQAASAERTAMREVAELSEAEDQGPEKHTNIKEYSPEADLSVLPAVPGRRATSHD